MLRGEGEKPALLPLSLIGRGVGVRRFWGKVSAYALQVWDYPREPERVPGYFKTAMADTTDIEA